MSGCQRLVSACLNLLQIVTEVSQTCHKLSPICHRTVTTTYKFVTSSRDEEMSDVTPDSASHTSVHTEGDIARAVSVGWV